MDVHVPQAVTDQLRRRGVDVLTTIEDGQAQSDDEQLLIRAAELQRLLFTHDVHFKALAEEWQRRHRPFAGLVFGHPLRGTIGQFVKNLELIASASELSEWKNVVEYIPF